LDKISAIQLKILATSNENQWRHLIKEVTILNDRKLASFREQQHRIQRKVELQTNSSSTQQQQHIL